jgi:hypothetical protein
MLHLTCHIASFNLQTSNPPQKRKSAVGTANSTLQLGHASISLNAQDQSSQASSSVTTSVLEPSKKNKKKRLPLLLQED